MKPSLDENLKMNPSLRNNSFSKPSLPRNSAPNQLKEEGVVLKVKQTKTKP